MAFNYTETDLQKFKELQALAYKCAQETAEWLDPGVTEKQAAAELRRRLKRDKVEDFFHVPFAWFGDRTAFRGFKVPTQFFATNRKLEEGMPFIVDCAPIIDGYTADIGYGGVLGHNDTWDKIDDDLSKLRPLILEEVRSRKTLDEVYKEVDRAITAAGNDNRHQVYPGRVIGHQVTRQSKVFGPTGMTVMGFGIRTIQTLGRELMLETVHHRSPLWADSRMSRHAPTPGLWAVEPHIGNGPVGLKFEELLVVTEDDVYWLDDEVPHVKRWAARAAA